METRVADRPQIMDVEPEAAEQGLAAPARVVSGRVLTPDAVKRMSEVRVIVAHTPEIGALFEALSEAQGEFEDLAKTRTARIESTKGKYTYDYETLADVIAATKAALKKYGLSVLQFPFPEKGTITIRTLLGHKTGQWIHNDLTASLDGTDPRAVGSGITYLCRYARKAILGIAAEDDDDAEGAGKVPKPRPQAGQRASEQPRAAAPAAAEAKVPSPIGYIVEVGQRGTTHMMRLDNGWVGGTTDQEVGSHASRLAGTDQRVELQFVPASDPKKYAPKVTGITLLRGN